jgi:BirA family biotin operon repressor/biotin-[acetyl-CoA-carboxylase] ligase
LSFYTITRLETVESTNSYLLDRLTRQTPNGTVIQAKQQTAGRGRMGRSWVGLPGNLFFSLFLKPKCAFADYPQLTHIAALAVAMTLEVLLPESLKPAIKWPNDVLVGGEKIAGILLEVASDEEGPYGLVIGIGVNLLHAPDGLSYGATCLTSHLNQPLTLSHVFTQILRQFYHLYFGWQTNGFEEIRQQWVARCCHEPHKTLSISTTSSVVSAKFIDLGPDGRIILMDEQGRCTPYAAGEIIG